jgi:hypothetical protein
MKKMIFLALLALTASAAQATEQPERIFKFDFQCSFQDRGGPEFTAQARVFADVNTTFGIGDSRGGIRNATNLIAVYFDDELIAANSAILNSQERFVQIQDANGSPSIFVRRDDHRIGPEWMKYEAFLAFDNARRIPGFCKVRSNLHDH